MVEFPTPLFTEWIEPATFPESLALHMRRHGDGCWSVWKAIIRSQKSFSLSTFSSWLAGKKTPRSVESLRVLGLVEGRYGLPNGHFRALLSHQARAATGFKIKGVAKHYGRFLPQDKAALAAETLNKVWLAA